jgi:hypothetical protein
VPKFHNGKVDRLSDVLKKQCARRRRIGNAIAHQLRHHLPQSVYNIHSSIGAEVKTPIDEFLLATEPTRFLVG